MAIDIRGVQLDTPSAAIRRFALLLWGPPGGGKSTLAATAPGRCLWINFDSDGVASLAQFGKKLTILDLSDQPNSVVEDFKVANPLRLDEYLTENEDIRTVVVDSVTSFRDKALPHGVIKGASTPKGRGITLEDPGYTGYGNLNTWTRLMVQNLLRVTSKHRRNIIFIAHEDKPTTDSKGEVLFISIMLGSSLNMQVPKDLSEVWHLNDTGKVRRICIRNARARQPMKTRMFKTDKGPEFVWNYDAETMTGEGIEDWYDAWLANGGMKIPLPGSSSTSTSPPAPKKGTKK